jgi:two-component system sensor histidine kinase KdpD
VTDEPRPDPDLLLAAIQKLETQEKRGKLKVFFGMSAGVGKTYAMLQAAHQQLAEGRDVVVAYVETHGRKETDALLEGLTMLPRKQVEHRGIAVTEMDLDAVLARKPNLALVDELAHTNAPGSRHPKRYQDVLELLAAGIDVYTTVNVQHIASRADTVREITGSNSREIVPDSVLDIAELVLIDISPENLIKRLDEGKVYLPDRAEVAMFNFFREGNLTALREMALRLTAERVGQDVRDYMQVMQIQGPWKTSHRLLVGLSPSPFSEQMARWTRRLADSLGCEWVAVYVETAKPLSEPSQSRLTRNLALARELGAEVITTADEDVVRGLLRVARQHNITQIVVGKPGGGGWFHSWRGGAVLRQLVRESGEIDLHVVRGQRKEEAGDAAERVSTWRLLASSTAQQYAWALGSVVVSTFAAFVLNPLIGYRAVALIFLFDVVGLALLVGRGPILVAATVSALVWNYFFLPPIYTLYIHSFEDAMMFGMYFVIAIVLGQLIARIRSQEKAERRREERATALYMLTRDLADAVGLDEILRRLTHQVSKVFAADVAILLPAGPGRLAEEAHPVSAFKVSEKEQSVADWVFHHGQPAGKFTDNLPGAEALYLPLSTATSMVGVMGVRLQQKNAPTLDQRNLLDAFVRQGALVMDRQRLHEAAEQAKVVAESERLGKTLLDSVSHEIRTPLAAITSAVSSLADGKMNGDIGVRQSLLREIQEAAARLNRIVGNLLSIARLESGHIKPKLEWCDVSDLVAVTRQSLESDLAKHPLSTQIKPGLPLVHMDFVLMEQALSNLLINAATYTPPGAPVEIRAGVEGKEFVLSVADRGRGLPPESVSRVFEKFYRAPGSPAGGTGLGLSIVKGFVEAQGGRVEAGNLPSGGAIFSLRLPLGQPPEVTQDQT